MDSARLFRNGRSQAVRLPKEYRFHGSRVYLKKVGNAVILIPEHDSWQPLLDSLTLFSSDFMADRQQPAHQVREELPE